MRRSKSISPWITGPLAAAVSLALIWQEWRRPLRRSTQPKGERQLRNLALAGLGAITVAAAESPLIQPLARMVARKRWGLLGCAKLPLWAETAVALLLMDYTFYAWHVLLHRIPLLWRFHAVHHVDIDMDVSTALRFHAGELLLSVPWRAAQVLLIGLTPLTFSVWQFWFALCVLFQHSNVRIPITWERRLNRLLVTPRMHGIHHSVKYEETNSNWSSGLTVWDCLHGTLRLDVPQQEILIGVPAFQDVRTVSLLNVLLLPFREQPEYWQFDDGATQAPFRFGKS